MLKWIANKVIHYSEIKQKLPFGSFATRKSFAWGDDSNGIIPNKNEDKSLIDNLEDYDKFLSDPHIFSCSQSRKAGMMGMEWEVFSDDKNAELVSFIENRFNKLSLHGIFEDILDAPFYGYQPLEVYWDYDNDNRIVPVNIIAKPAHWFKFDKNNQLKFMSRSTFNGELIPPRKILLAQHKPTYKNPYGTSVLSRCYHHAMFKQGGTELWLQFVEKYGMPLILGTISSMADNNSIQKLFNMLMEFKANGVAAFPETVKVENINSGNLSASTDVYLKLINYCNAELSKAILSQTLTTESSDTGAYAMSQTHMEVRKDVVISDSQIITKIMNKLIQWIIEINFPEINSFPYFRMFSDLDIDLQLAQRDKLIFEGGYCKPTKKYLTRRYGFKEDEIIMVEAPAKPPTFSEGHNHSDFNFDLSKFDELTQSIIKPILQMVEAGEGFDDIEKNMIELFPDIDTSKIEEYLAKAFVIAHANGMMDGEK